MKSNGQERISLWQFFILIVKFELGTTVIIGVGLKAKQDVWLAFIIALLAGSLIIWFYTMILKKSPNKNVFEIMDLAFGTFLSRLITFLYVIYFLYLTCVVLRDFSELITAVIFPNTPIEVIAISFTLVVIYILYLGPEVLGRVAEIFFPYTLSFLVLISLFEFGSGAVKLNNLQPVLAEGIQPVLQAVFPGLITFPFGETIVFLVLMSHLPTLKHSAKVGIAGVVTAGLLLAFFYMMMVAVLGVDMANRSQFPLLYATRQISVANFIERLDAFVVFDILLGVFIKVSLFFYGCLKGIEHITKQTYRNYTLSIGMVIPLLAILVAPNTIEHIEEGLRAMPYLHIPFEFFLPILLFIVLIWKNRKKKAVELDAK